MNIANIQYYSYTTFAHTVPPQIRPFSFGDEPSNSGESLGVQCAITKGDLPINITWTHNGIILDANADGIALGRLSTKSSTLNIDYISGHHRGIYKCIASNLAGDSVLEAELLVNGIYLARYIKKLNFCFYFLWFGWLLQFFFLIFQFRRFLFFFYKFLRPSFRFRTMQSFMSVSQLI